MKVLPEFIQLSWQDNVVPVAGLRNPPTAKGLFSHSSVSSYPW